MGVKGNITWDVANRGRSRNFKRGGGGGFNHLQWVICIINKQNLLQKGEGDPDCLEPPPPPQSSRKIIGGSKAGEKISLFILELANSPNGYHTHKHHYNTGNLLHDCRQGCGCLLPF